MENCASAGPNCSNSGSERGPGPLAGQEREKNAAKRMDDPERAALPLPDNSAEESPRTTRGNKKRDRVKQSAERLFRLSSVPFTTRGRGGGGTSTANAAVAVANCAGTRGDYGLSVPRNRAEQVTVQVLLRLGEEWTI